MAESTTLKQLVEREPYVRKHIAIDADTHEELTRIADEAGLPLTRTVKALVAFYRQAGKEKSED